MSTTQLTTYSDIYSDKYSIGNLPLSNGVDQMCTEVEAPAIYEALRLRKTKMMMVVCKATISDG